MAQEQKTDASSIESLNDRTAYIVSAVRSPIGTYGGSLSPLSAPQIASQIIKGALTNCGLSPDSVEECILGNVLQANIGQNSARQASIASGIPYSVPCTTLNKICSSGMKSIMFGAQSIMIGHNDVILCGGMESMSNVPYYVNGYRFGVKMMDQTMVDGMVKDGLWDVYTNQHMGNCAEICATKHNITREQQDDFAIGSFKKSKKANDDGTFANEIVSVSVPQRRGDPKIICKDEGCNKLNEDKLRKLKGAFDREKGTVTAANSSQLSDGAAIVILCSGKYIKQHFKGNDKLIPLCEIMSFADAAQEPVDFPTTPALAIPKAMKRMDLKMEQLDFGKDYFEINEAFSVAAIANAKLLKIPMDNVNVNGGAVGIGHPLGCSGARIVVTLLNVLKQKKGRYGIAGICNGGGGASALIIKNI
eukprot:26330_1